MKHKKLLVIVLIINIIVLAIGLYNAYCSWGKCIGELNECYEKHIRGYGELCHLSIECTVFPYIIIVSIILPMYGISIIITIMYLDTVKPHAPRGET